ncbi:MAG: hypothetical protein ACLR0U_22260 [Enterocloster clostridioformis]
MMWRDAEPDGWGAQTPEHLEQAARPPIRQTMEECAKLAKAQESKERAAPAVSREAR